MPFGTRLRWALQAIWYAVTGQHPREGVVMQAALSREDYAQLKPDDLDQRGRDILDLIEQYEQELRLFRTGGRP